MSRMRGIISSSVTTRRAKSVLSKVGTIINDVVGWAIITGRGFMKT